MEFFAKFVFGAFENFLFTFREIFTASVDIEIQHGHRRLVRRAFASFAALSGSFQRTRNLEGIAGLEHSGLKIQGIARPGNVARPLFRFAWANFFLPFSHLVSRKGRYVRTVVHADIVKVSVVIGVRPVVLVEAR